MKLKNLLMSLKKRNVKTIGLSVDTVDETSSWLDDINDIAGVKPSFPISSYISKITGITNERDN